MRTSNPNKAPLLAICRRLSALLVFALAGSAQAGPAEVVQPAGWEQNPYFAKKKGACMQDTIGDNAVLRVLNGKSATSRIIQIEGGAEYKLRVKFRGVGMSEASKVFVRLTYKLKNKRTRMGGTDMITGSHADWLVVEKDFKPAAEAVGNCTLAIRWEIDDGDKDASFLIDDLSLTKVGGDDIVENGDFEKPGKKLKIPFTPKPLDALAAEPAVAKAAQPAAQPAAAAGRTIALEVRAAVPRSDLRKLNKKGARLAPKDKVLLEVVDFASQKVLHSEQGEIIRKLGVNHAWFKGLEVPVPDGVERIKVFVSVETKTGKTAWGMKVHAVGPKLVSRVDINRVGKRPGN